MIDEDDDTIEVVDNDAEPIEGEHQEQETQDDVEARAKRMGWQDEETYRGPRHKWTPAEEYVRRAEEELPVLRAQLRKYDDANARYEKTVSELKQEISQMGNDFKAFHSHYKDIEQQSYDRAIRELKQSQVRSVEEADTESYHEAQRRIDDIERQKAARAEAQKQEIKQDPPQHQANGQQPGQPTAAVREFISENDWFQKSPMLSGAMIEHSNAVMSEKPYLSEAEVYAEAKQRVVQEFPDRFPGQQSKATSQEPRQNMRRNQAASVASPNGSTRTSAKKGKSFDDLPDDAKAEFTRFASRIPGYSKEEYVKSYRWS